MTAPVKTYFLKNIVNGVHTSYFNEPEEPDIELLRQNQKKHWWSTKPDSILTQEETKILKRVKSRAHFLDRGLTCCCFQIGFDALIGLIPVVGDFIGLLCALQLIHIAMEASLPQEIVNKMLTNIAFDFLIGLLPVVGDLLDIMYKCNTKNALLFETYLLKRRQKILADNSPLEVLRIDQ